MVGTESDNLRVINNTDLNRFEVQLDHQVAVLEYQIAGKNIIYTHTEVPPEYEGRGIAATMARFAMEFAREQGYKVQALCPYVNAFVRRHPEYHSITWGF